MTLLLKNFLFTLLVPGTVAVVAPLFFMQGATPAEGLQRVLAWLVLALGGAIYGWCVWDFARFGRGTPAPIDAPRRLVVRGLYRYTRNPMYLGVLTVILGWVALFGSLPLLGYAIVVASCFHAFTVLYEEPHLTGEFGAEYEQYCARVGRWIPRPGR